MMLQQSPNGKFCLIGVLFVFMMKFVLKNLLTLKKTMFCWQKLIKRDRNHQQERRFEVPLMGRQTCSFSEVEQHSILPLELLD